MKKIKTRYANKILNENFYEIHKVVPYTPILSGSSTCVGIDVSTSGNTTVTTMHTGVSVLPFGYVFVPYVNAIHTEESLAKYNVFMNKYSLEHKYCPKCGRTGHSITLMGYFLTQGNEDEYKDLNSCHCSFCGDRHTAHDRVSTSALPTTYKILSRNVDTGRQFKKRVYTSHSDYLKYCDKIIDRYSRQYDVEIYSMIDSEWVLIHTISKECKTLNEN